MPDIETILMKEEIMKLLWDVSDPLFRKFFDSESNELLPEKISVLKDLKEGKTISQIPAYYDVLELYPKNKGNHWDY